MSLSNFRHDWTKEEIAQLFSLAFMDLLLKAHLIHRENFKANTMQISSLLSIKTGNCPENCAYCPQSGHYEVDIKSHKLFDKESILAQAKKAKEQGATRFCMGAAWRSPPDKGFNEILPLVQEVKELGLQSCFTLGMLSKEQAQSLAEAGLDYYNHNLDTSPEFYPEIISTRTYADRLQTLAYVREAGIKTCCGGIMGMGESREDRISFLQQLVNLPEHPESVPINRLIPVKGTPLEQSKVIDNFEFIRVIAVARILMPKSVIRFSAGREFVSEEMQTLCFFAGANSIFHGEKLLTAANPSIDSDRQLLSKLDIEIESLA